MPRLLMLAGFVWLTAEYILLGPYAYSNWGGNITVHYVRFLAGPLSDWYPWGLAGHDQLAAFSNMGPMELLAVLAPVWTTSSIAAFCCVWVGGYFVFRIARDHLDCAPLPAVAACFVYAIQMVEGVISDIVRGLLPMILWWLLQVDKHPPRRFGLLISLLLGALYGGMSYTYDLAFMFLAAVVFWFALRPTAVVRAWPHLVALAIGFALTEATALMALFDNVKLSARGVTGMALSESLMGQLSRVAERALSNAFAYANGYEKVKWVSWLAILLGLLVGRLKANILARVLAALVCLWVADAGYEIIRYFGQDYFSWLRGVASRLQQAAPLPIALAVGAALTMADKWIAERKWTWLLLPSMGVIAALFVQSATIKRYHFNLWRAGSNLGWIYGSPALTGLGGRVPDESFRVATIAHGPPKGADIETAGFNLEPQFANGYHLESFDGISPLTSKRYVDLWPYLFRCPEGFPCPVASLPERPQFMRLRPSTPDVAGAIDVAANFNPALLALGNVRFLISQQPLVGASMTLMVEPNAVPEKVERYRDLARNFSGRNDLYVYQLSDYLPRAFVPSEVRQVATGRQVLESLSSADTAMLRQRAFVLDGDLPPGVKATTPVKGSVSARSESPERWRITSDIDRDGIVVVLNAFHPRWQCRSENGAAVPLIPADHMFWGLWLPAGHQETVCTYRPLWSFR